MSGTLLIINADDFGLTPGVNEAIVTAFERGVVTSTSMLAVAPAFDDAVARWRALGEERPGVGAHLALVGEDPPLLPARDIASLVDGRGRFRRSWRQFLARAAAGRIDAGEVRAELRAQLERIIGAGIAPTHLDTHQHLHLWPVVRGEVLDLATEHGIDAIRVPRASGGDVRSRLLRLLASRLAVEARARGLRQPEHFAGLDESGHLDTTRLLGVLRTLPADRSIEIGCHPGVADDPPRHRYRWGFEWPAELAALCDPAVRREIDERGFRLGSFAEL